jgi:hypothetical protein
MESAPVWRIVSVPQSGNFNYPPTEPGDPLSPSQSLPERFVGFFRGVHFRL